MTMTYLPVIWHSHGKWFFTWTIEIGDLPLEIVIFHGQTISHYQRVVLKPMVTTIHHFRKAPGVYHLEGRFSNRGKGLVWSYSMISCFRLISMISMIGMISMTSMISMISILTLTSFWLSGCVQTHALPISDVRGSTEKQSCEWQQQLTRKKVLRMRLSSGWFNTSEKYESIGMIIPNVWENKSHVPVTTNQSFYAFGFLLSGQKSVSVTAGDSNYLKCRGKLRIQNGHLSEQGIASCFF